MDSAFLQAFETLEAIKLLQNKEDVKKYKNII
jgi:hypothetical protein